MAFNISALLTGAGQVAAHPITQGGALASLITGALYVASAAGVVVPPVAFALGPIAGLLLYKFLPPKAKAVVDETAAKVVETFNEIPKTYPAGDVGTAPPAGTSTTNLVTKDGTPVNKQ